MIVFACSGPGAAEAIQGAMLLGWGLLGLTVVGVAIGVAARHALGRSWRSPGSLLGYGLVLLHPGLCVSAMGGDCGRLRELLCWGWSGVGALWLVGAVGWALVRRNRAAP